MAGELLSGGEEKAVAESAFGNGPDRPNAEPSLDEDREQDELLAAIEHSLNNADDFMELSGSGQPDDHGATGLCVIDPDYERRFSE
jgi:hypothetical protein